MLAPPVPLTFLAMSNEQPLLPMGAPDPLLPNLEDMVGQLPHLQQVSRNGKMYDIQHAPDALVEWSEKKTRFREECDFFTADAHWLMSYRMMSPAYAAAFEDLDDLDDGEFDGHAF